MNYLLRPAAALLLVLWILLVVNPHCQCAVSSGNAASGPEKYHQSGLGENVFLFDPQMDMGEIQALVDSLYALQHDRKSEFSTGRYALLFKPGSYQLNLKMGYYMQALGLGRSPEEVVIYGGVLSKGFNNGNVTLNFWRGVENLTIQASSDSSVVWGVSQASPMRRVHIRGNIRLHDNGWASGGFLADSKVDGKVLAGPQQQWFSRNVELGKWEGGSWNMMFVGSAGTPEDNWPANPYSLIEKTPFVREKPYLVFDNQDLAVSLPEIRKNSLGISWGTGGKKDKITSLTGFYIVKPGTDNAASVNAALKQGKNLLFTPGIYPLEESLKVDRPGTIVLGIGMATLVSSNGNAIMEVADVDGVTVSGLLLDAGKVPSETLLRMGGTGSRKNHSRHPSFLHDLFFRVGGPAEGSTGSCLTINSNHVVVDHTWIWRADHGSGVGWAKNRCANGLIVNGEFVTIYGLFNEHFQEYQTLWNGNHGRLYFYQSELPYDPPTVESWKHGTTGGYASYKVSDNVTDHEAWGLGIYCVFYAAPVVVNNTIETPPALEKYIHHKIIFWLNGIKESKILNIINEKGGGVNLTNRKAVMD